MKTFQLLAGPLLLAALAASWASAQPLQDTLDGPLIHKLDFDKVEIDADVRLEELLDIDPSLLLQLDPDLIRDKSEVDLAVDPDVVLELLRRYQAESSGHWEEEEEEAGEQGEQATEEDEEEEKTEDEGEGEGSHVHQRRRRQTTVSGGVDVNRQRGGRRITGSLNVDHTWRNKHTLSGNLGVDHTRITGLGRSTDYTGGLRYTYRPNRRTSFSIGGSRNWGSSGRSHSLGLSFSHKFGRKRRSPGRIKIKCRSNGDCKIKVRGNVSPQLVQAALAAVQ